MKTLSPESEQAAICGAIGCHEPPEAVVRHPDYGERVVCSKHAEDLLNDTEDQPPGGRASGERSEPVRPQARGTGPRAARPSEGAPTGATDLVCGSCSTASPTGEYRARPTPVSGTCLLRHFSGSTVLLVDGTGLDAPKSGDEG